MKAPLWRSADRNIFSNYNRMMQIKRFYKMFLDYSYIPSLFLMDFLLVEGRFCKDFPVMNAPEIGVIKFILT